MDGDQQCDTEAVSNGESLLDVEDGLRQSLLHMDDKKEIKRRGFSRFGANETSQTAMIGANISCIESLDYEIVENDLLKQGWRARTRAQVLQYVVLKWTLALLVGFLTGILAFLINMSVENVEGPKLVKTSYFMRHRRYAAAFVLFSGTNLLLVLFAAALCAYVCPVAAGSGIPEVKAYLNGIDAPDILAPKTLIVKILGNIGVVAGSLYVDKQGPLVHMGACIAALLSQGGSNRYHLNWKWLRYFKNDRDRRDLVACGAAAGVAGAFRAPVGGVLFVLEEATSWWRSSLLWRSFFTTAVVAVVLQSAINYCKTGRCGLFGSGGLIMFDIGDVTIDFRLIDLFPVVILGIVGGFLGSLFNFISGKIVGVYSYWHCKYGPVAKLFQALLISILTSLCMFGLPWVASCTPCPPNQPADGDDRCPTQGRSGNFKPFGCPAEHYNDLAGLFFNPTDDVIRNLFSINTANEFQYTSMLIFLVASFALALVTYGTPVPSGHYIPVIMIGAAYGRLTGMIMRSSAGLGKFDEGVYAVLGAASLLGGSMRTTVSLCVILLELTNNLLMLPLTMLVLLISKTIGDLFNRSIYAQIVQIKGLPFLEDHEELYMKHLTALDVCTGPPVTLLAFEKVGTIVEILRRTNHNGFPVIDIVSQSQKPVLHGLILRSHLLVLLKRREFLITETKYSQNQTELFSIEDFAKPGSGKGATIDDIELTAQEEEMFIDLHPFTNMSPYTVADSMSLAKAFTLFRELGLRHLLVVPKKPGNLPIVGILTRHDFMPEHVLKLYPHFQYKRWKGLRLL